MIQKQQVNVFLATDAISSQRSYDRQMALMRLEKAGCIVTTVESILFELMGTADYEHFKTISSMIKQHNLDCMRPHLQQEFH